MLAHDQWGIIVRLGMFHTRFIKAIIQKREMAMV